MLCFYYLLHNFLLPKQGAFSFRALGICTEQPRGYLGSLARFLAIRMFHLRTQADTVLRFPIPVASNPMAFASAIQVSRGMFLYKSGVVYHQNDPSLIRKLPPWHLYQNNLFTQLSLFRHRLNPIVWYTV